MKSFEEKYVIYKRTDDGMPEIDTFTEDKKGNRIPFIFDTPADAVLEIADHMKCVADAVKSGDYEEDRLDDAFGLHVAKCSLYKGNFIVWIENEDIVDDNEIIYDGSYKEFIISIN